MPLLPDFSSLDFNSFDFQTTVPTGPPYPPAPQTPIQSPIGTFAAGISPIGDIIPFSFWDTIISQYANSNIIVTLIGNFQQYIDQTMNMDLLYDNIWNVATAQGYGLDVWGRIVGVQRTIQVQAFKFFGFEEQTPETVEDFGAGGVGCFYSGVLTSSNYSLADLAFRQLIYAKALANISDGSIPSVNTILRTLFPGRGNCYVTDGLNMSMTYTFKFKLSTVEYAIISASGVLPKSTGVSVSIIFPGFT